MEVVDVSTPQLRINGLAESLIKELKHHVSLCRQIVMAERAVIHLRTKIAELEDEHDLTITDEHRQQIINISKEGANIG